MNPKQRLAVIGAGWLGATVGKAWVKAGYEVMFSSRHPQNLKAMVDALGTTASVGTPQEAAKFGSILLFAVPGDTLATVGHELRDSIKGKIILDATNTSDPDNAAVSRKSLEGARLVRAFSAVDATEIEASFNRVRKLAVPLASDDLEAMDIAAELVRAAGCEPLTVGSLSQAKLFQRKAPGFRAHLSEPELRKLLQL